MPTVEDIERVVDADPAPLPTYATSPQQPTAPDRRRRAVVWGGLVLGLCLLLGGSAVWAVLALPMGLESWLVGMGLVIAAVLATILVTSRRPGH